MHDRISDFFESNNILYNKQFGFSKNHFTTFAITEVADKLTKAIDQSKVTTDVFLNLWKAFDMIKHMLFDKLEHCDIRGLALTWLKSYLTDTSQQVIYSKIQSNLVSILCGVPQGSILASPFVQSTLMLSLTVTVNV